MATGTTATATDAIPSRAWRIVFVTIAMTNALAVSVSRRPPFTDLPEHVAAIATLARLLPGGGGAPYEIAFGQSQVLLYDFVGAVLTRLTGDAITASRILLAVVALAWSFSFRALVLALGRDERLALFAPMAFWNRALMLGFVPYIASVPLFFYALALLLAFCRAPSRPRAVVVGLLALLLFYTHASTYLLFVVSSLAIVIHLRAPRAPLAIAFAPSVIATLAWWQTGSLTTSDPAEQVGRLPIGVALHALPLWTFDIVRHHLDEVCSLVWWAGFAALIVLRRREARGASTLVAMVPFACAALMYVAAPFHVGAAVYLNLRLAPVLALLSLLALRIPETRPARAVLGAVTIASLMMGVMSGYEMRRAERELLGVDFDALLAQMRPHTKLVMLNFEQRGPRTHFWPYVYAGSYHRARGGDVASYSFSELPHWPLHYASGTAPPPHRTFWVYHPCVYRYLEDGAYYDYALVQGAQDPFTTAELGPKFVAVARSGVFTLYAKDSAARPEGPSVDGGPCQARP